MHLETAEAHIEKAAEADPRTHPYGVYSVGPSLAPIGVFCWFKTPAEMVRGVVLCAHFDTPPEPDEWAALIAAAAPDEAKVKPDCTAALCHLDDRLIWAGTFDVPETGPRGILYCLEADGAWSVADSGFAVCNGPAFSPDGRTMYFSDSIGRRVLAYDISPATRIPANRRVFASFEDGVPDGLTVDAEGCLWCALYGAGRLVRFAPDGAVVRVVNPCPEVHIPERVYEDNRQVGASAS